MSIEFRTRLSHSFLLLVVLTGWLVAPLVHEIEHAQERAEMTHVHDVRDGDTLRTGCDSLPWMAHECPVSLTKVQAIGSIQQPFADPGTSTTDWDTPVEAVFSRFNHFQFVRGPPSVI